jgi:hypothetical protein
LTNKETAVQVSDTTMTPEEQNARPRKKNWIKLQAV